MAPRERACLRWEAPRILDRPCCVWSGTGVVALLSSRDSRLLDRGIPAMTPWLPLLLLQRPRSENMARLLCGFRGVVVVVVEVTSLLLPEVVLVISRLLLLVRRRLGSPNKPALRCPEYDSCGPGGTPRGDGRTGVVVVVVVVGMTRSLALRITADLRDWWTRVSLVGAGIQCLVDA